MSSKRTSMSHLMHFLYFLTCPFSYKKPNWCRISLLPQYSQSLFLNLTYLMVSAIIFSSSLECGNLRNLAFFSLIFQVFVIFLEEVFVEPNSAFLFTVNTSCLNNTILFFHRNFCVVNDCEVLRCVAFITIFRNYHCQSSNSLTFSHSRQKPNVLPLGDLISR